MFVIPDLLPCDFSREGYLPSKTTFVALTVEMDLGMFRVEGPTGFKLRVWCGTDTTDPYQPMITMFVWNLRQFIALKTERVIDRSWRNTIFPKVDAGYVHLVPRRAKPCL